MIGGTVVKCGRCGCEYDALTFNGCPQCGFGKKVTRYSECQLYEIVGKAIKKRRESCTALTVVQD